MPAWTFLYVFLFWPCLLAVAIACALRGDRAVRFAALMYLTGMVIGRLALSQRMYAALEIQTTLIDLTLFGGLVWLATRYPRWWLIALAALQLLSVVGHLSRAFNLTSSRLVYAILTGSGGYPAIILLSCGLIAATRSRSMTTRRHAFGSPDATRENID